MKNSNIQSPSDQTIFGFLNLDIGAWLLVFGYFIDPKLSDSLSERKKVVIPAPY